MPEIMNIKLLLVLQQLLLPCLTQNNTNTSISKLLFDNRVSSIREPSIEIMTFLDMGKNCNTISRDLR